MAILSILIILMLLLCQVFQMFSIWAFMGFYGFGVSVTPSSPKLPISTAQFCGGRASAEKYGFGFRI